MMSEKELQVEKPESEMKAIWESLKEIKPHWPVCLLLYF